MYTQLDLIFNSTNRLGVIKVFHYYNVHFIIGYVDFQRPNSTIQVYYPIDLIGQYVDVTNSKLYTNSNQLELVLLDRVSVTLNII